MYVLYHSLRKWTGVVLGGRWLAASGWMLLNSLDADASHKHNPDHDSHCKARVPPAAKSLSSPWPLAAKLLCCQATATPLTLCCQAKPGS